MLTITINGQLEQDLHDLARQNKQTAEDFALQLLEKQVTENNSSNGNGHQPTEDKPKNEKRYMRMKGMFSSGKTDTSELMSDMQSLDLDLDPAEGFSVR